jgi:hypothetical protein
MEIIEYVEDYEYWETFYIKKYKSEGHNLLNWDDEGKGTCAYKAKEFIDKMKLVSNKMVKQYDLSGNFLNEYPSTREAARILGFSHSNISRACNGIFKHTGGFLFKYSKDNSELKIITNPNAVKKIVIKLDESGNILEEYPSVAEAARRNNLDGGNVSKVCNGINKKTKNLIFKFKDDYEKFN